MRTKISRWGNSLGLRIPKQMAQDAGLDEGADVDLKLAGHKLVLAPARREYSLKDLASRITPRNRHRETEWGRPVGHEIW
jgi:antitoxin MazE